MTCIRLSNCTRLGNWMFQYAAAKCACPEDDIAFVVDDNLEKAKVEKYSCLFGGTPVLTSAPEGAVVRTDLYQDVTYLDPAAAGELYRCPANVEQALRSLYGSLLDDENLVSIHVRRGDYLRFPHRHPFVGKEYLRKAVSRFAESGTKDFAVCSDDIRWCKSFFTGKNFPGVQFHFSEGNSVVADLFLMRRCRGGHICSNSTFSWWGAYRSSVPQPPTIFPSMWYGPAVHEEWRGLYFDGSEIVENRYTPMMWLKGRLLMMKNALGDVLRKGGLR